MRINDKLAEFFLTMRTNSLFTHLFGAFSSLLAINGIQRIFYYGGNRLHKSAHNLNRKCIQWEFTDQCTRLALAAVLTIFSILLISPNQILLYLETTVCLHEMYGVHCQRQTLSKYYSFMHVCIHTDTDVLHTKYAYTCIFAYRNMYTYSQGHKHVYMHTCIHGHIQ